MFGHIFGRFLVEQKMISQETLEEVLDAQRKVRVKLGLIAVSEKLLTQEQADKINRLWKISVSGISRWKWDI